MYPSRPKNITSSLGTDEFLHLHVNASLFEICKIGMTINVYNLHEVRLPIHHRSVIVLYNYVLYNQIGEWGTHARQIISEFDTKWHNLWNQIPPLNGVIG